MLLTSYLFFNFILIVISILARNLRHRYTNNKHWYTDTLTYRADFLHISSAWGCSEGKDLGSKLGLGPRQAEADHRAREGGAGQVEGNLGPQPREVAAEPR